MCEYHNGVMGMVAVVCSLDRVHHVVVWIALFPRPSSLAFWFGSVGSRRHQYCEAIGPCADQQQECGWGAEYSPYQRCSKSTGVVTGGVTVKVAWGKCMEFFHVSNPCSCRPEQRHSR